MAWSLTISLLFAAWAAQSCVSRERRPDGPYRAAEDFADALSDEAVACTRDHTPAGSGDILVAAEFKAAGEVPLVHDAGSLPGSDAALECIRQRVTERLRSPATAPAPFVRIRVPVPLVTSEVKYVFMQQLARAAAEPVSP